jgi:hypothetical protein
VHHLPTRPCLCFATKKNAKLRRFNSSNKRKRWANFWHVNYKKPANCELKDYLKILSKAFARMFKQKSLKKVWRF